MSSRRSVMKFVVLRDRILFLSFLHSLLSLLHLQPTLSSLSSSTPLLTMAFGPGQKWGEVFRRLEGTGYNVPGGQFGGPNSGIGVGGYTLSGGYGWCVLYLGSPWSS